jgi:hypothetical protein
MKKYRFRGKPVKRFEWMINTYPYKFINGYAYGSLVQYDGRAFICTFIIANHNYAAANGTVSVIEVKPETVEEVKEGQIYDRKRIWDFSPVLRFLRGRTR